MKMTHAINIPCPPKGVNLSEEWVLENLAPACKRVREIQTLERILLYANDQLAATVLIMYDSNHIKISRAEFSNIDPPVLPDEYSLALPYPLYALITKLQQPLNEIIGCPVTIERLWGYGLKNYVHYQLEKNNFTNITIDKSIFSCLKWSDNPVENAGTNICVWQEMLPFVYAVQDVFNNFNKNIKFDLELLR